MKVVKLIISNFLCVKAVSITPDGNIVRIEGKNEAGKSSIINALWSAILGTLYFPKSPIRKGEKNADVFVDLGDITVERKFTEKGMCLEVKDKAGFKSPSPQSLLNKLCTHIGHDPNEFMKMKSAQRRVYLLDLTGKSDDLNLLDSKRKKVFEERTIVNRDVKTVEGKLAGAPADEPVEEKSVVVLMERLNKARKADLEFKELKEELSSSVGERNLLIASVKNYVDEIKIIQDKIRVLQDGIQRSVEYEKELGDKIENFPSSETDAITKELSTVEEHNSHVREIKAARDLRVELARHKAKSDNLTAEINKIDAEKNAILTSANIPIDNFEITDDDILIDGIPFDDLSTSKKIRISMAIGIATNPKFRVMRISQGSELDSESMAEVRKFAEENDIQVWVECVANAPQEGIFIQDGEVFVPETVGA